MLILIVLLTTACLLAWTSYCHFQQRRQQALETEVEVAEAVAQTFQAHIDGIRMQLDAVGAAIATTIPQPADAGHMAQVTQLLTITAQRYPSMRTMNWVSADGTVQASNYREGFGVNLSFREFFRKLQAGEPWAMGTLTATGAFVKQPTMAMGVTVLDGEGKVRGMVVASIEPTRLGEVAMKHRRRAGAAYSVFDSQGVLVYNNPPSDWTWQQRVDWRHGDALLQQVLSTGRPKAGIAELGALPDGQWMLARVPIGRTGWVAGAGAPEDVAMAPLRQDLLSESLLTAGVGVLAFAVAFLLARTISSPLTRLEEDAPLMAKGTAQVRDEPLAPEEVQHVRLAVESMAADLREQAKSLRRNEQDLNRAQAVARAGSWRLDVRRNELLWSLEIHRIFGVPAGTPMTYEAFLSKVHPEDREEVDLRWQAALAGEVYDLEHRILVDGQVKWVHEKAELEFDETGQLLGGFGTAQDITERRQMENDLRRSRDELEHRVRERTAELNLRAQQLAKLTSELTLAEHRERRRLARTLHDQLQQLLVAAKLTLDVMLRRCDAETRQQGRQIDSLLDEAIATSRSLTVELSPPILHEGGLAAGLEWLARWMQARHGLAVKLTIDPDAVTAREDIRVLVFQAARELLFNVVKHAGVLSARVDLARVGEMLRVTVSDEGVGFDVPAMWRKGRGGSAGLGLLSMHERLTLLGGGLEITSSPGKGSTFVATAPMQ